MLSTFKLMKCVDITKHEKACEIATLFIGYLVSGYLISISAYQLLYSNTIIIYFIEYFVEINA